ncbi:addiction module protein [Thiocapsa bogorovii]|uniref:addiction module protein n=1 Tax=Thiocapsa bogorovii TaxID=521689 RepID=UPI001E6268A3|nr:addiction module protein [Thiocapsa bogorovii]UHD16259.1 addiction module protein [Thiocapsa bogorovii]
MTAAARKVLHEAIGLSAMERAELIDALLRSFDPKADEGIADAWRVEAESRIDAFDAGELTDDSAEAVFARINRP